MVSPFDFVVQTSCVKKINGFCVCVELIENPTKNDFMLAHSSVTAVAVAAAQFHSNNTFISIKNSQHTM